MPKKKPRKWVWIIMAAALVLGSGAVTAVVLVNQAAQTAEHKTALTKHADAITAYEAAWAEFDRQNADTRDDQGQLSMTSLDNAEEVNEAFLSAIAAADELEHQDFDKADPGATNENLGSDTQRIETATGEVQAVTKQLADASALFLDSHRQTMVKSLTNEIENAQQTLDASRDTGDVELVAQLEQAISDAQVLADDPKAHPTDLRTTMENLNGLADKVKESAGPQPGSVAGSWVIPNSTGDIHMEMTSTSYDSGRRAGALEFIDTPTVDQFGSRIDFYPGCLFFIDKGAADPTRNFFVYCPIGAGKPTQSSVIPSNDVERLNWHSGSLVETFVRE